MTVGYNYAAQRHGLYTRNINLGTPVSYLADGRPVFGGPRVDPFLNQINLIESGGNTNYNALFLNLQKRLSKGFLVNVSWTWSHALANTLGEGGAIQDPTNLRCDYGNAENDVRHYVVGQMLYEPRITNRSLHWINGFELSSMMFDGSGYPINVTAGTDLNKDCNLNDRPLFAGRNSVAGPSNLQVDARLQRTFVIRDHYRVIGMIETENPLNSTNPNCTTSGGCTSSVVSVGTARRTSAGSRRHERRGTYNLVLSSFSKEQNELQDCYLFDPGDRDLHAGTGMGATRS